MISFILTFLGIALALLIVAHFAPEDEWFLAGSRIAHGNPKPLIRGMAAVCLLTAGVFLALHVREGVNVKEFSETFPLYPKAQFTGRVPVDVQGRRVFMFRTRDDPADVARYYEATALGRGWRYVDSGGGKTRLLVLEDGTTRISVLMGPDTWNVGYSSLLVTVEKYRYGDDNQR